MSTDRLLGSLPLLSSDEIKIIHDSSLQILKNIGVIVNHEEALEILADSGAITDKDTQVVRLPKKMVEECLTKAPHEVPVEDRNGHRIILKQGMQVLGGFTSILNMWDLEKGEPRRSTKEDVVNVVTIQDALPAIKVIGSSSYACDVPQPVAELETLGAMITSTTKYCSMGCSSLQSAEDWLNLAKIVSANDNLAEHPIIGISLSPISPLKYDFDAVSMLILAAQEGIQATLFPMTQAGGTGPFTLAGTIALQNAETLLGLVLSQVVAAGSPIIVGSSGGITDMRTGNFVYAAPESLIIRGCASQMARYYGLPSYSGLGPDALSINVQGGAERMLSYCAGFAAGITLVKGAGYIGPMTLSYEQLVIDNDLWLMAERLFRGVEVTQETLGLAAIERVGSTATYLMDEHTLDWLRREPRFHSSLIARPAFGSPEPDIISRAKDKVRDILENHKPDVSDEIKSKVADYISDRSKELITAG